MFKDNLKAEDEISTPKPQNTTTGQFSLDDSRGVMRNLLNCFKTRTLCDIVLVAGCYEIPCHRFILSASSNVFQVMLTNNCWSEFSSQRVVLHEPTECLPVFEQFIEYMYGGSIDVPLEQVIPVLLLADKYNVRNLVYYCWEHLLAHMVDGAKKNCLFDWMVYAKRCCRHDVYDAISQFVRLNFELVARLTDWVKVDLDTFRTLINQSNLVVTNEQNVFLVAQSWLLRHMTRVTDENEMRNLAMTVLSQVRYPMMSPRQIAALSISPLAKMYEEFFITRMARGMSFHCGQLNEDYLVKEKDGYLQTYPRIYTEDALSTQITVENAKQLPIYHKSTLVFSTSSTFSESLGENLCEWVIELNLKGVLIEQSVMIAYDRNLTVPGASWQKNRLSITCKDPPPQNAVPNYLRVKICILMHGTQNSETCVIGSKEEIFHFTEENRMIHFYNIVPYEAMFADTAETMRKTEAYFIGPDRDKIQMHVVIVPLPLNCF